MKRLLTALLLMILVAIPLQAEKYALLVGINGYQNNISPLRFCLSDVKALRQVLIDPQIGAFKADNVWLMTDDSKGIDRPTDLNIVAKLESLSRRIQTGDTFIFVFAGHGINREQKSFLLAINSDSRSMRTLEKSAVPLEMVSEILSEIRASQTLTIIDACRNDPSSGRGDQENALTSQFARGMRVVKTGATSAQPSVTATLYACSIGERAYEWAEKKHGVFSYYLMEGLRGGARNAKGEVTAVDLAGYTQEKVSQWSESQYGNQQTPWLDQSGGAKLVLVEALSQSEIYRLDISSDPAGFDIWINDQSIGSQTPKLISRPSGTYRILLKKRGYQDFRRTVTVSSEQAIVSIVARPIQIRTDIELGRGMLFVKVFDETERETSAEISLNGKLVGQAPYTDASIPEGNHQVVISKDLYHQYVEDLTVTKDQKSSLTVILKPAFGGLRINTDPPAASISLRDEDGVRVGSGTTPYHQPKLGSGRYRLDLSKNRYYSQNNRSIEINDGKTTSQSFELIPKFGTLVINSQPRGAKVLIAGQDRGQTPLKLEEMDSAQYLIEVEQALYLTYSQTVEVRDGETTELEADLVSNFGTLDLSQVSPVGARISIGGKSYGRSPTKVDLEPGSYDIQLSKKGYESQEIGGVLVVRGQTELIEDQLVQMVGKLKIQSSPAEAEIKLNGKSYGTTPNVVANLAVGDYELELSKEGYQPYQQTVRVEQKTTEINHQLKDKPKFETGEMVLIPGRGRIFRQPAFYMDKYEVTNAQYRKFVQATGHRAPRYWDDDDFNQPNQPVVGVSWHDATAYAKWVGKRLPTEKEWEWAARGGLKGKKYPWGNQEPSASRANYGRKRRNPTAVGNYPANGYGLHDMAGNVWEWCQDWYDRDKERVLRGGSWDDDPITLRVSFRGGDYPDDRRNDVGFRCVSGSN